jgi:hypothetical protein
LVFVGADAFQSAALTLHFPYEGNISIGIERQEKSGWKVFQTSIIIVMDLGKIETLPSSS